MNWLKEETAKLVRFIETAPEAELDALLAASKFGSLADEKPPEPQGFITFKMVAAVSVESNNDMEVALELSHNFEASHDVCLSTLQSLCVSTELFEEMPLAA